MEESEPQREFVKNAMQLDTVIAFNVVNDNDDTSHM
jgi:hypothetical protein